MPDSVTAALPIRAVVWSLLGALVGLWLGYAVVAGAKHGPAAPRPAAHARPAPDTAPVGFALTAAPALRVRSSLFAPVRVRAVVRHTRRHRTHAKAAVAAPAPQTAMTPAPAPVAAAEPMTPVQTTPAPAPAPRPTPKPKRQSTLTAQPKQSSGPDFDESSGSGFDNSG